jgi:hypothetical protein
VAQGAEEFSEREVARLTLQLDEIITRMRRGASTRHIARGIPLLLPIKPTRTEFAVLTALAQTYGPAILRHDPFGLVLDCIAERGAVVLVQRVLWGEQSADVRLAALLLDARIAFELLCGTWPDVFMAQAHAELRGFRRQPPLFPASRKGDDE